MSTHSGHNNLKCSIIALWERIDTNDYLKSTVIGISLRLNVTNKILYFYGSLILSDSRDIDNTLVALRDLGIKANRATFWSFLLNNDDTMHLRAMNNGMLIANEFLTHANILCNASSIDSLVVPAPNGSNNAVADLIPAIVQEVLRNLGGLNQGSGVQRERHRRRRRGSYRRNRQARGIY